MNRPQVFIPSRGRSLGARKLTQAWHREGFDVHWVVEPDEHDIYFDNHDIYFDNIVGYAPITEPPRHNPPKTFVHGLPVRNGGIGCSRNYCARLARAYDYKTIIMADDDIKPGKNANMLALVNAAQHPKILGITARYSYHDLCLRGEVKDRDDLILLPTGTFRLVALNVRNVLRVGNYDKDLHGLEDNDLFLRGLQEGYPWLIHCGTYANSIGGRYQPGGLSDFMSHYNIPKGGPPPWYKIMAKKYPGIVSGADTNRIRFSWRKAYDKYMPEWRQYSALHGGDIKHYLDAP